MSVKITDLPATTTLDNSDILPVVKAGVTSKILFSSLKTLLAFQAHSANLDTYAGIAPLAIGQNILALAAPGGASYMRVSTLGVVTFKTPAEVLNDVGAQPLNTNLTEFAGINPGLPGLNILRLDVPLQTGYVQVASGIDSNAFIRSPAQVRSDIGAFASASLDDDSSLGGGLASAGKASSQRAIKKYVDSRVGATLDSTFNDDTVASATIIDLDATNGSQIRVTGTIPVVTIILAEKDLKTLVFDGAVTFTASASLLLPAGLTTLTAAAGGKATVAGGPGSVVTISQYFTPGFAIHYGGDFSTGGNFITNGTFASGSIFRAIGTFRADDNVWLKGALTIEGTSALTLTTSATTSATLPAGTTNLVGNVAAPATASSAGVAGQTAYDATHFYQCISANTWVRCALATW